MSRWLLPEGISDVLPTEAAQIERLRRALLDLYRGYGYEQVIPPLVEYLDSLLTGTGHDLDLRTFKLVDQLSGRQLGLRADITPQTARIDAHILNRSGVVRLCYAGAVLHTRPGHPLAAREPLQVGAELYGFGGLAADAEIQCLAAESLRAAGVRGVQFDLGHTGITRTLLALDPAAARWQMICFPRLAPRMCRRCAIWQHHCKLALATRCLRWCGCMGCRAKCSQRRGASCLRCHRSRARSTTSPGSRSVFPPIG
jgi:ATP phosphoribosyltransferase regulatory subunit